MLGHNPTGLPSMVWVLDSIQHDVALHVLLRLSRALAGVYENQNEKAILRALSQCLGDSLDDILN